MSVVLTSALTAKTLLAAGAVVAAGETPAAAGGDQGSLYVAVSGVLVALISATAVVLTSRNKQAADPVIRYVDPPTRWELVNELSELYSDQVERATRKQLEAEMWRARAEQAGWDRKP